MLPSIITAAAVVETGHVYVVSRRGLFKVTPIAVFDDEQHAEEYTRWLNEEFTGSYTMQQVAKAN